MNTDPLQHGAQLHAEGRLDEAEAVYRALLDGPPQQAATARHLLGLLLTDRGDQPGALAHYDQAIALGAASADLFFRRGELQRGLGRPADAVESYDRAIALGADAEAHHARGVALASLGRLKEALESYDRALTLRPTAKNYWNNRSVVLEALGRFEEAILSCRQAITLDPHYVQAHHNAGSALLKAGLHGPAVASFDEALTRNPNIPEAWNFRAVALASQSLYEAAEESAARALALRPDYPEAHNNRSIALRALKQPQAALAAAEAALAVRPDFSEALNSKGSALVKLNRFDDACDAYRSALRLKPLDAAVHLNLGMALEALGALDEALEAFAEAERLAPDLPDARFASGLAHIRAGDVRAGFRLYETRWSQRGGPQRVHPEETLWLGETPLGDRTLLIHSEQGFGDVIQFSRFAPDAGPPSHVILQVQPALTRLLSTLDGVGAVIGTSDPAPPFDVHIPVMSLPLALGLEADQLAPRTPYLHASTTLLEDWRRRLPAAAGPRVGLAWTGNPSHDNDHNRSLPLRALQPLLAQKAQFVSLHTDYRPEDLALLERTPEILRFEGFLDDFADTAALIACCDVVIAVDTSVAHLAGALGKPLWLMLPRFSDWRWMNDRTDTPWYPSATLIRQTAFGVWDDVIDRVADRLKSLS